YIEGICPHCGSGDARGDQCDSCGRVLDANELISPRCKICSSVPEFRETEHFYLLLSKLEPKIRDFVNSVKDRWRPNTRNNTENFMREGLRDRAITRDLKWGVPIPLDGYDEKRIYVWFEAVCGYLSSSKLYSEEIGDPDLWESYWKDPDCRHYYFLAKDNIPFHTIIWPGILAGYGGLNLPYDVPSNEYLQWDGSQFSKSREHGVTVNGFLKDHPVDPLRFYLSINMPERGDSNFDVAEFVQKNNTELLGALGNYLHRVVMFMAKNYGELPGRGTLTREDKRILEMAKEKFKSTLGSMERVRLKEGIHTMMSLVNEGNRYINAQAPWKLIKDDRERCGTVLNVALHIGKVIMYGMYPYIPHAAGRWFSMLGVDDHRNMKQERALQQFPDGIKIDTPKPLFTKLEYVIEEEDAKEAPEQRDKEEEKKMEHVEFDEFKKLDLRVAKVLEISDHPNADRLYVLKVDLGEERPRTIVAGLREHLEKEDILGKKIIVVTNLKPAKMRGITSDGMLLAAGSNDEISLLTIEKDMPPGSKIH
ncbi:MAG: methionine--tRNA ligase, partial [Candidatus Thermoplasmatota archaeon]|nr:methionine--tRNA ligase [Candidatus Thermoplasmatota archaeon]